MQRDFYAAYRRHWNDAEYLYNASRMANADHLYGYSAECGLKYLMQLFGMHFDPITGDPPRQKRVHINQLWDYYETYITGIAAADYTLCQPNPFDDWDISDRYAHERNFDQIHVDQHKRGAEAVQMLIQKAILAGQDENF
jgi:hypothetical protein